MSLYAHYASLSKYSRPWRVMVNPTPPTQSTITAANRDKEDRFSRLTRPTRSSSQKTVEPSPRPPPRRPQGPTKPAVTVSAEAGRRPRATSIALIRPVVQSVKPVARSPPRYGNDIPRPAASKNAALVPPPTKTPVSPPKSAITSAKKDEPSPASIPQEHIQDDTVVAEAVVTSTLSTHFETSGVVEEIEQPPVGDGQTTSSPDDTQLVNAAPSTLLEAPEPTTAEPVDATDEPPSDVAQELESNSPDVSVNGSLQESTDALFESPDSNVTDAAVVNTSRQEEIADVVPVNEAAVSLIIDTATTDPDALSNNIMEDTPCSQDDGHEQADTTTDDDGSATLASKNEDTPRNQVVSVGFDTVSKETTSSALEQGDSTLQLVDSSDPSVVEEVPWMEDDKSDNNVVCQKMEGKDELVTDSNDMNDFACNNDEKVIEGKHDSAASLADRFVTLA